MTGFGFDAPTVIRTKRDGGVLSDAAIDWVIENYTSGVVHDEQMSALLMAIFLRGMTPGEISRWTAAMIDSGERFDFGDLRRDGKPLRLVDKHSTGGVGDKITIPLVPVVMACGAAVPQAAGRGLGHTGGTLDKLEAISGFTAELSKAQIRQQLQDVGAAIFAAGDLAPADRKIYALRDVTATTESLPLIASSVMSKKLAEGARALVLDTKVGRGAFLTSEGEARELAATMVALGTAHGVDTRALLTDMDRPLGLTVGNAVEVAESLDVLAGGGPDDVVELTVALARRCSPRRASTAWIPPRRCATARPWTASGTSSRPKVATSRSPFPSVHTRRRSPHPGVARWATSTRWRWDWRCGGSVRAARPPVVGCSSARGCAFTASPVTPSLPARRCSPSTPTPRSVSPGRLPSSTAVGPSATRLRKSVP